MHNSETSDAVAAWSVVERQLLIQVAEMRNFEGLKRFLVGGNRDPVANGGPGPRCIGVTANTKHTEGIRPVVEKIAAIKSVGAVEIGREGAVEVLIRVGLEDDSINECTVRGRIIRGEWSATQQGIKCDVEMGEISTVTAPMEGLHAFDPTQAGPSPHPDGRKRRTLCRCRTASYHKGSRGRCEQPEASDQIRQPETP